MEEAVLVIGKVILTIGSLFTFILGLVVAIDPAEIGIRILEAFKIAIPNPMIDQYISMLRIVGVVFSIAGFVGFLLSLFFLWRD
jgi:preprotein translocase subunit Sss1